MFNGGRGSNGMFGTEGGGLIGGLGSGLLSGILAAKRFQLEQAQEDRQKAMADRLTDPNSPANRLLSAQANVKQTISLGDLATAAGYALPKGANPGVQIPASVAPSFIEHLASLKGGSAAGLAARSTNQLNPFGSATPGLPIDLTAKDRDDIKRIEQGLTNLKQVEQQYKATGMDKGSQGLAGMILPHLPGPWAENQDPGLTKYLQSTHEAKNAYARAAFGRVSNELIAQSGELFPKPGNSLDVAQGKLNELSNTLKGVANSVVKEKISEGRPDQAQALQQHFDDLWGGLRFFPELDKGTTPGEPGPGQIQTTFRNAATPDQPAQVPAPSAGATQAFDPDQFAKTILARRAALAQQSAAPQSPGGTSATQP